jgi:hypothetical protein
VRSWGLSAQEQEELWRRWRRGESLRLIARQSWRARLAWVVVIDEPHPRPSALEPL